MSHRFICPYCRVAVDPAAMEVSHSECAELRVCPYCDTPVMLAVRGERDAQHPDRSGGALQPTLAIGSDVDQRDPSEAAA